VLAVLVTAFDTLLATITTVVYGIMQLWQVFAGLVQTIEVGCRTMITALVSVATAANHLAKGEFSQILPSLEKPWEDAAAQLENIWVTRLHNMQAEGESFVNTIKGLFSNLQLSVAHGLSLDFHEGEHAPKDTRPKAPALPEKDGKGAAGKGEDRVSEWRNELQQQLMAEENYFNDSKKEELAFWQDKLQLTAAGSKEQFAVESTIYQLKKSLAKEAARDALTAVGTEQKVSDERFARYRAAYAGLASLGKISATEQVTLEKALLDEQWVYDQAYFEKKRAAAAKDTAELKKLDDEALLAYQKMLSEKQGLDIKAAEASKKAWEDAVAPIQRAFDTAFQGVIQGTQTLKQAFAKMMQSIVLEIAQAQLKKVFENQLKDIFQGLTAKLGLDKIFGGLFGKSDIGGAGEGALGAASKITATQLQALGAAAAAAIAKMTGQGATATPGTGTGPSVQLDQAATQFATTVQAAATQFQTTIQAAATGSSTTQQAGAASASATEAAGAAGAAATQTGAGATFASEVDAAGATFAAEAAVGGAAKGVGGILGGLVGMIPVVGPFLQGVGKIAGIFERGGIVPTAAGGWALPNFSGMTLAGLHGGEMVLPQDISQGLQGMIKSGGGGGVMNLTITAMDGASVHKVLMANAPSIMAAFNKASRNGSFPRTS
jgi:hypothetical protein